MAQLNSPIAILKLLDKSNCGKCSQPTCLAFASAVFNGSCQLNECPSLSAEIIKNYAGEVVNQRGTGQQLEESTEQLKKQVSAIEFSSDLADKLGARYSDGILTIPCMGQELHVDKDGNITSDIHVHAWITGLILNYIINCSGTPVSGEWITFRALGGGREWASFFAQRCEKPLKKVADNYTRFFEDMLHIFNGQRIEHNYPADISIVLHPLPKVPVLFCYTGPEDGLESTMAIFFDSRIEEHLDVASIYALGTGLATMFGKFSSLH